MFLLDYYIPNASPNGVCVEKVAKCFVRNGWGVTIVCFQRDNEAIEEEKDGIEIFRVCTLYNSDKKTKFDGVKFYSKWFISSQYPITERKEITQQFYKNVEQLLTIKDYEAIICVHLPVETLIAGALIKTKYPKLNVIAYMLDSLSGGFVPRFLPEEFARKRKLIWENNIFKQFDRVFLMQSSKEHHIKYVGMEEWYDKAVYLDIPLLERNRLPKQNEKINCGKTMITFCGLLNDPYRHVKQFLEIAKQCNQYKFIFAGSSNIENHFIKIQNNTNSNITYFGQIQHSKVEELLTNSDVLLNLGVTVPSAISGKIFEYMSYGKPIISTYSIDNEACIPYLQKYPLGLLLDERSRNIKLQAQKLIDFVEKTKGKQIDYNSVEKNFYLNTPQAFVDYLNNWK